MNSFLLNQRQDKYYDALAQSDNTGESTIFIEFMLEVIQESLKELLDTQNVSLTTAGKLDLFKSEIKFEYFTRKDYLQRFKSISPATASRDLKYGVDNLIIEKFGEKNRTKYRFKA